MNSQSLCFLAIFIFIGIFAFNVNEVESKKTNLWKYLKKEAESDSSLVQELKTVSFKKEILKFFFSI